MEKIRISKLEIQQVGPFGELLLEFPEKPNDLAGKAEIHILTGENGTGKTTILEMLVGCLKKSTGPEFMAKRRQIRKGSNEATLILTDSHPFFEGAGIRRITAENIAYGNNATIKKYWQTINQQPEGVFSYAFFAYSGYRRVANAQITGISELSEHPLSGALDFQQTANPQLILQWLANTIAAEAIAKSQGEEAEAISRHQAINQLEAAISKIIEKPIRFRLETKPYKVGIEVDGERLDFNQLPDGLKSIVSWLADLLMRMDRVRWIDDIPVLERPFLLFLDEIEVHMHPSWQRKILPAVQGLFPNAQIFISTHSPFVVGSVDGAWIHKLVKPNGDSKLAAGYPMLSEDAKSYRYWLEEVFDVANEYGMEAEKQLKFFYQLRDTVLKGGNGSEQNTLVETGRKLAEQSQEVRQIIEMELRQVNRRRSLELSL